MGVKENASSLDVAKQLMERLQPDVLVLESKSGRNGRRSPRIGRQRLIANYASGQAIEVHRFFRR